MLVKFVQLGQKDSFLLHKCFSKPRCVKIDFLLGNAERRREAGHTTSWRIGEKDQPVPQRGFHE